MTGAVSRGRDWGRVFLAGGLVARLQLGLALGCSSYLGLGWAVPVPHVPEHPTSICDEGVNSVINH